MNRLLHRLGSIHPCTSPERNPALSVAGLILAATPLFLFTTGSAVAQNVPATPAITLAVSAASGAVTSVPAGTPVTLTATVPASGRFLQQGIVRFCDSAVAPHCTNENKLGNAQLTKAGSASFKFTPGPGQHSFTAVFLQQRHFNTVTSAGAALNVTTVGTSSTTLAQSGSLGSYTLTAKVTGAGLPGVQPTGSVQFLDTTANNAILGTSPLVSSPSGNSGSGLVGGLLSFLVNTATTGVVSTNSTIAAADFNGDGKLDAAVVGVDSTSVSILLGNGDGTFTQGTPVGNFYNGVFQIKHADFNQDGKEDLALVDRYNSVIHIFLGNGDGTFKQAADAVSMNGPQGITITDFNNDGIPDMIVANRYSDTVSFMAGKGDGTFTSGWDQYVSYQNPTFVLAGDFNGDGKEDFVVNVLNGSQVAIFIGNGDGTFANPVFYAVGNQPAAITAGDFDNNGITDLAVANQQDNTITVLTGKGDGTFTSTGTYAAPAGVYDIATADFNGDGKTDLVVSTSNVGSSLAYLFGNGNGTFSAPTVVATGAAPLGIALGDFNNDGVLDVASANAGNGATVVLTKLNRSVTATLSGLSVPGTGNHQVVAKYVGDLNFGTSTSAPQTLQANTVPTYLSLYTSTWISTYGQQVALTASLYPYSVAPATSNGETVTFYCDGQAVGTAKLNSGSATLNITSLPVGLHSLTVSYAGDAMLNASTGYNLILVNSANNGWWWW